MLIVDEEYESFNISFMMSDSTAAFEKTIIEDFTGTNSGDGCETPLDVLIRQLSSTAKGQKITTPPEHYEYKVKILYNTSSSERLRILSAIIFINTELRNS